jgi:toxin ParE1/3/4
MKIIFTAEAKSDLNDLRSYLQPLSPSGITSVTTALEGCIRALSDNPRLGRATPHEEVREIIEPKYGFIIPYITRAENLFILRIYRTKRKPLDYGKLSLPR